MSRNKIPRFDIDTGALSGCDPFGCKADEGDLSNSMYRDKKGYWWFIDIDPLTEVIYTYQSLYRKKVYL
jgi:hypothetical protein